MTLNITQNVLNGSDGCNDYGTGYGLRGDQLHLTGLTSSTARGCLTAPGTDLLGLLAQRPTVTVVGQTLTLRGDAQVWVFRAH